MEDPVATKVKRIDDLPTLSAFETLPDHVLELTLSYVSKKDILALTLTSKHLNAVISNNSRILQAFEMVFPMIERIKDGSYQFSNVRKYSKWIFKHKILNPDVTAAVKFMTQYAHYAKELTYEPWVYYNYRINKNFFSKILSMCNNLQSVSVFGACYTTNNSTFEQAIVELPHLRSLNLTDNLIAMGFMNLFQNCRLKKLQIKDFLGTNHIRIRNLQMRLKQPLKDFLEKQDQLEHLAINQSSQADFFDSTMKFKLKSFSNLASERWWGYNDNLTFLHAHKDTLEKLQLYCSTGYNFLDGYSRVTHLELYNCDVNLLNINLELVKVLKLEFCSNMQKTIADNFPSLIELHLANSTINTDILLDLPHIEIVMMYRCTINENLSMSKLKHLTLKKCVSKFSSEVDWSDNRLEELFVIGGDHAWIQSLIKHKDTNLKIFKLTDFNQFYQCI